MKFTIFLQNSGRLMWSAIGASIGIGLALGCVGLPPSSPFLLASFGGSSMFLFALTRAPAAQPRALFIGHLGSALMGILCYQAFGDALWVYLLAVVAALLFMQVTKSMHPPAGANPLIMVQAHANISSLWQPVGLGVLVMAVVALIWSRILPGTIHYPVNWFEKSPPTTFWGGWYE
ncbi:MAG: HPP family protein [Thermodesulfobacteriota bacterium]